MIDWLYRTSLEVSLLIGLVLILRPFVRHLLGAHISYWLWLLPVARCFMWNKPEIPAAIIEKINLPNGDVLLKVFPNPDSFSVPAYIPIDWIWLTGFVLWLIIRILGFCHLQNYLKEKSQKIELPSHLMCFVNSKKPSSKLSFCLSEIPSTPFVGGLIKPQIYLPMAFFQKYNEVQQQCIINHELTHLKRKDLWSQIIGELIRAIFWFNPIVHIAWNAFREDQELACDQQVLRHSNDNERYEYGRALVKGLHAHVLPATLAFFSKKKERFIMLEKHKNSIFNNVLGLGLCAAIAIFALTKAPVVLAQQSDRADDEINLSFTGMPLSNLTRVIFGYLNQEVIVSESLDSILVTAKIEQVPAQDALKILLQCHGYKMQYNTDHYTIEAIDKNTSNLTNAEDCLISGFGNKTPELPLINEKTNQAYEPDTLHLSFANDDEKEQGGMVYFENTKLLNIDVTEIELNNFVSTAFYFVNKDIVGLKQLEDFTLSFKKEDTQAYLITTQVLNCFGFSVDENKDHYRVEAMQNQEINASTSQQCIAALAKE